MERHEKISVIVDKFFRERQDQNPYASAEKMRALDALIRNGLADGLARASAAWRGVYQTQSRTIPMPTRENPFPDSLALARVRAFKRMSDNLSEWVSRVHALEAPANDRVYHRIRNSDQLLELLIALDYQVATTADAIDRLADTLTVSTTETLQPLFENKLQELESQLRERSRILSSVS